LPSNSEAVEFYNKLSESGVFNGRYFLEYQYNSKRVIIGCLLMVDANIAKFRIDHSSDKEEP